MNIITKPTVTLVSRPQFLEPQHLPCDWVGDPGTDGARLAEYAGRVCYLSYANPARRSSGEYIENILKQRHGSVLEHANYSLLIEGISRSCSHELVRHRAGFAFSQQSQRFVDESACSFVMPPLVQDVPEAQVAWMQAMEQAQEQYRVLSDTLFQKIEAGSLWGSDVAVLSRKVAREAARSVLPNATEVKIVVTANVRAWRHMLEMRASVAADREIRAMAVACLKLLQQEAPEFFGDFTIKPDGLGGEHAQARYGKV